MQGPDQDQEQGLTRPPARADAAPAATKADQGQLPLTRALVLDHQRSIGNGVVARMLQQHTENALSGQPRTPGLARPVAGSVPVVQRVTFNMKTDGTISSIAMKSWPSRPPSNMRGKQGQHLTAYVAFEDAIINRVTGRTVKQAAAALLELLGEYLQLPGMASKPDYLVKPIAENVDLLKMAMAADDAKGVGAVIDNMLQIRNAVPGTAQGGTGGGKSEAKNSGILNTVEAALRAGTAFPADWTADGVSVEDQVRNAMWRLLDYHPSGMGSSSSSSSSSSSGMDPVTKAVLTHYLSMRSGYPLTFAWLTDNEHYLVDYLRNNRKGGGMPLGELTDTELEAVIETVHKNL